MFSSFYNWLQSTFDFWFGSAIMDEPVFAFILKNLSFFLGLTLLYYLIAVPILVSFKYILKHLFGGW